MVLHSPKQVYAFVHAIFQKGYARKRKKAATEGVKPVPIGLLGNVEKKLKTSKDLSNQVFLTVEPHGKNELASKLISISGKFETIFHSRKKTGTGKREGMRFLEKSAATDRGKRRAQVGRWQVGVRERMPSGHRPPLSAPRLSRQPGDASPFSHDNPAEISVPEQIIRKFRTP